MDREETFPGYLIRGAIGGAAATLIVLPAMSLLARRASGNAPVLARLEDAVTRRLGVDRTPAPTYGSPLDVAVCLIKGAAWGAAYGAARYQLRFPTIPFSQIFGLGVFAADSRLLPRSLRVLPTPSSAGMLPAVGHVLFGTVLGLVFDRDQGVVPASLSGAGTDEANLAGEVVTIEEVIVPMTSRSESPRVERTEPERPISGATSRTNRPSGEGFGATPPSGMAGMDRPTGETAGLERPVREVTGTERPVGEMAGMGQPEPVGAGANTMSGTMPTGAPVRPPRTSMRPAELHGQLVYDRDEHAIGHVKGVEERHVEVETPIVALGPTLYIPYDAFGYCAANGCYLSQTLEQMHELGWNHVPAAILAEDQPTGAPGEVGANRPTPGPGREIPYLSNDEEIRAFRGRQSS